MINPLILNEDGNAVIGVYDKSVRSVTIPERVDRIGLRAFEGCSDLDSIVIPASVRVIADYAFSGCTALKSLVIPATVEEIGLKAFEGCVVCLTSRSIFRK